MSMNPDDTYASVNLTLYSAYQPIERYRHLFERLSPGVFSPQTVLRGVDIFLIRLLTQFNGMSSTLVDLAAEATWGASAILGLTDPHIQHVIITTATSASEQTEWRHLFEMAIQEMGLNRSASSSNIFINSPSDWNQALDLIKPYTYPMVILNGSETNPTPVINHLDAIFKLNPQTLALVLPIGFIGQSCQLRDLIMYCSTTQKRLVALRELSSFLSSSQLALIYHPDNHSIQSSLTRIQQLYSGNFQFLDQVKTVTQIASTKHDAEVMKLRSELSALNWIYTSKAWKVVERYYTLRQKLIGWLKR